MALMRLAETLQKRKESSNRFDYLFVLSFLQLAYRGRSQQTRDTEDAGGELWWEGSLWWRIDKMLYSVSI